MNNGPSFTRHKLGDISESIEYGFTASANKEPVGPRFLRITDIQNDNVSWEDVPFCECPDADMERYELREGDIVFARTGATTGKSYLIRECPESAVFASYLIRVRPSSKVSPDFLSQFFRTPDYWSQISGAVNGSTQPGVNGTKLKELQVPLPPLPEQRRLAAILDKADAIRRKREEGIRLTEELLRSTFLEMFGDPATNPKRWPLRVMGDVVNETQYGTAGKSNADGRGIPVLRMNNITYTGELDLTDLKWCEIEDADLDQLTVKRGDLLFNRTNSPELVGKTAVWDRDDSYAYAGYLFRVRFDEAVVLPDYVSSFLNSAYGKKMLFAKAKPSNNMSNFSAGVFCRIELPVPDIGLQRRFAKLVHEIGALKKKRRSGVQEASDLFASLVQRAFRGEL